MTQEYSIVHQKLVGAGYPETRYKADGRPETGDSEWHIILLEYDGCRIIRHCYDCDTEARAKAATKALLKKQLAYEVKVHKRGRNVISFHAGFGAMQEHEWDYYFKLR